MKICKACGAQLNEDVKFCTKCGADTTVEGAAEIVQDYESAPAQQYAAPDNQGNVYYQPGNDYSAESFNNSSYQQTVMNGQPIKKKKKLPAWAIVLIVLACLGILFFIGIMALGVWGMSLIDDPEILDKLEGYYEEGGAFDYDDEIEGGIIDENTYVNDAYDLAIDITGSDFRFVQGAELAQYVGAGFIDYTEALIADENTGENVLVMNIPGSITEAAQDMDDLVRDIAGSAYEGITDSYEMSDTYKLKIGGETYTCVDVTLTYADTSGEPYQIMQTLCFAKGGLFNFLEIQFTLYPDFTGTTPQSIIDSYFSTAE